MKSRLHLSTVSAREGDEYREIRFDFWRHEQALTYVMELFRNNELSKPMANALVDQIMEVARS